ncbi:MAG: IS110 family transposase [Deltaproteobacteria bacterium]|nr:IS110 family transposase [Deltaproteobacteria bacterium]
MNTQESIRLKKYCQLRKEIRGSDRHLIIGIDIGKDKHHAFMGTATGKSLLRKVIFENNIEGYEKLLMHANAIKTQNGLAEIVFGIEPTGNYHKPLGKHLIECGFNLVLVSGVAVKRNRELLDGRWDKHDTKDAANISDLISQGKCLFYESPSLEIEKVRNLLSLRRRLKREEHSLKMRIRNNILAMYFPELDKFFSQSESENLAIIRWCLDTGKLAGLEFNQFYQMVTTRDRGAAQRVRLKKIQELAIESVGCSVNSATEFEAMVLVDKLRQIREVVKETEGLIEAECHSLSAYHSLLTIPGFGPFVSASVLATIGNPFRFSNRKQVVKLAGLDLGANRSGKTSQYAIPVISKKGSGELRYALYQAAHIASIRNKGFIQYYTALMDGRDREKGIKTKLRVKLAAKLLVIAWTLMKTGECFDPDCLTKN